MAPPLPPGPRSYPLVGTMPAMARDPLGFLCECAQRYGAVTRLSPRRYLLSHPDAIQHILQERHRAYQLSGFSKKLRPLLGEGVVTSEGLAWRSQRRMLQPAFHRQQVAALAGAITSATLGLIDSWQPQARAGVAIDIVPALHQLTLQIVADTLFGYKLDGEAARRFMQAIGTALNVLTAPQLVPLPQGWSGIGQRRFAQALRTLDEVVAAIIAAGRAQEGDAPHGQVLALLLGAHDTAAGDAPPERAIRDQVLTLLLAGYETSATVIAWACALIARHPVVSERLCAEVDVALAGRVPTADDVGRLPYTRMVIEETMRLYPPTWLVARTAIEADEIAGYPVQAGMTMMYSPYVMHRHPAYWDSPERFDPERFAPERTAGRSRFVYLPFSSGPRQCIGAPFALLEMQLIVALLVQRYRMRLAPGQRLAPQAWVVIRPRHGVHMTLQVR